MAIVCHYGKPEFFIPFICHPKWQQMTDELLPQQTAANHPYIVARVFLEDLCYKSTPVLGKVIGLIYVVEWQKCGPPHANILAICDSTTVTHTKRH